VAPHVAAAENVRAALLYVERKETPLGIVYATDAASDPKVETVGVFPEDTHPPLSNRAHCREPQRQCREVRELSRVADGAASFRQAGLYCI
jgi:ABC-type molybdate transport system substrate-binding protein